MRPELDHVADAELPGQRRQGGGPAGVRPARAADDDQAQVLAPAGLALDQPGDRADEHVGGLERLDPPHEEHDLRLVVDAEQVARLGLVAGVEGVQVDAGRHHRDLLGTGPVRADEVGRLVGGVGREGLGAGHDLRLAERAQVGLADAALRPGAVLDVGHRVHRVHQRQPVAAAEHEPGHARQPVVAVHEVVRRRHRLHPLRELRHQVGEVLLGDGGARSRGHVQDAQVVGDLDDRVGRAAVVAGEDVDVQAPLAEAAGDLGDVDVQPAGVTDAGRRPGARCAG